MPDRVSRPPGTPASGMLKPARAARPRGRLGGRGQVTNACVSLGAGLPLVACTQHARHRRRGRTFGCSAGQARVPAARQAPHFVDALGCRADFGETVEGRGRDCGGLLGCREALAGTRGLFWPV